MTIRMIVCLDSLCRTKTKHTVEDQMHQMYTQLLAVSMDKFLKKTITVHCIKREKCL